MDEFRGIQTALFLMLLLQFTGAATGQRLLFLTVRDGDEVTLSCNSVTDDQNNCDRTIWFYNDSPSSSRPAVVLVRDGKISEQAKDKSDRLSVTENCSLVIKKVTEEEDAGHYTCRQFGSGQLDAAVYLSFVTMTEQKNSDEVTLTCSVGMYGFCRHKVKWLFQGKDVDKDNGDLKTSQSDCSASVTFRTSHYIHTSSYQSLTCEATDDFTRTPQRFPFRLSGEDTTPESPTPESPTPESSTPTSGNSPATGLWVYAVVAAVLAALLIIVVAVIIWKRRKGNTQMDVNVELTSGPAVTQSAPESSQDTADPEDGVSYVSVSYTKKANGKAKVRNKTNDDAVTYTTVKASSADPSSLYATIN